jgi:hypothetical protein
VKKLFIAALLILALVPLSLGAQTGEDAGFKLLSVDVGYGAGWNLAGNTQVNPALFGLNFRVASGLSAGIQTQTGGGADSLYLLLKYNILPQARATVGFGTIGTVPAVAASSVGFEVIPFSRTIGNIAATAFKLAGKYDSTFAALTEGRILFFLALGIGF